MARYRLGSVTSDDLRYFRANYDYLKRNRDFWSRSEKREKLVKKVQNHLKAIKFDLDMLVMMPRMSQDWLEPNIGRMFKVK